jgi:hypothetical protein
MITHVSSPGRGSRVDVVVLLVLASVSVLCLVGAAVAGGTASTLPVTVVVAAVLLAAGIGASRGGRSPMAPVAPARSALLGTSGDGPPAPPLRPLRALAAVGLVALLRTLGVPALRLARTVRAGHRPTRRR